MTVPTTGYNPETAEVMAQRMLDVIFEANPFAELARVAELARARILPRVGDPHLCVALGARFDELSRHIEFLDHETRRFRLTLLDGESLTAGGENR